MQEHEQRVSFLERLKRRIRRFFFVVTWLLVIVWFGSISLSKHTAQTRVFNERVHALERITSHPHVVVDKLSITFLAETKYGVPFHLAGLKSLLQDVQLGLETVDEHAQPWRMAAFADAGYRGMRFHSEGEHGVAWVLTAYQLAASSTTYVALRTEYAHMPYSIADIIHKVTSLFQTAVPAMQTFPRTNVVLHARTLTELDADEQGLSFLHELGVHEVVRVHDDKRNVFMAGVFPETTMEKDEGQRIEMLLKEDEQDITRVLIGMPQLGMTETM